MERTQVPVLLQSLPAAESQSSRRKESLGFSVRLEVESRLLLYLPTCVTLGKSPRLSEPQFPYLSKGTTVLASRSCWGPG